MPKLILFDIDFTLIDTDKLRSLVSKNLIKVLGVDEATLAAVSDRYVETLSYFNDFNYDDYLLHLSAVFSADFAVLKEATFTNEDIYRSILYPDTIPTLKDLQPNFTLGLYSEGFVEFQSIKIGGILSYFDPHHRYILRRKSSPESLASLPPAIVVDDNPEIIAKLISLNQVQPIWLNRLSDKIHPKVSTIHSLKELKKII